MKYLNYTISAIIRFICVLSISFVWLNYYFRKFSTSLIASISIAIFVEIFLLIIEINKNKKNNLTRQQNKIIDDINLALEYMAKKSQINYFANILKNMYCSQKYSDCIISIKNKEKVCFVPSYNANSCSIQDAMECIKIALNHNANTLVILTNEIDSDTAKYISKIDGIKIEIFDTIKTYKLLILNNPLPECKIGIINKKYSFKDYLSIAFDRNKTKGYLTCGLILIFSSLFVPYNIYYVVMGTLSMIFALVSISKKRAS